MYPLQQTRAIKLSLPPPLSLQCLRIILQRGGFSEPNAAKLGAVRILFLSKRSFKVVENAARRGVGGGTARPAFSAAAPAPRLRGGTAGECSRRVVEAFVGSLLGLYLALAQAQVLRLRLRLRLRL